MANVLISHFSPVKDNDRYTSLCFFDALAQGFLSCGHNVKQIVSTRFLPRYWNGSNEMHADIDRDRLQAEIEKFAPDLCVFANNSVPEIAYKSTNCPVVLLLSDTVQFFNDKDLLKRKAYGDRIFFYAPFQRDLDEISHLFGPDAKVLHCLPATGVEAENTEISANISYIGSHFQNDGRLARLIVGFPDRKRLKQLVNAARDNSSEVEAMLTEEETAYIGGYMPVSYFSCAFSARNRILTLALLAEEGLALYGTEDWAESARYFPDVAAAFDPKKVYSLKHNQDIYNGSKLCVSISHAQAIDGFPWRVMDIMASNGCLLSDRRQGIVDFTKGYVDLPLYESPAEARELAVKLLRDDVWRKDIVEASQRCIRDKGRWHHRFAEIEGKLGIKLLNDGQRQMGQFSCLFGEDYVIPEIANPANDGSPEPCNAATRAEKPAQLSKLGYFMRCDIKTKCSVIAAKARKSLSRSQ